ncbi:MAG: Na/Pi cotransporter family protein [Oligoflexia bacterium]|nr:Na/Pi cotransporter family protein [Oligoflexia bacterium]
MNLYEHLVLLSLGICFFMYGMQLAADNLQILMAERLRLLMAQLAKHKVLAILSGILITVILQSSGAVTVMLVNLASAGVVTLQQVMGVIVGTAVGTTVTVQLISFKITQYAPYFLIFGFCFYFFPNKKRLKEIGSVFFGFGLIFYGLLLMGRSVEDVKQITEFQNVFKYLSENPFVAFIATTIFTSFIHSSAVTVGLAMTLVAGGVISLLDSMYWVAGANLGTTSTALLASFNSKHAGRLVAWAHFFYKAASVVVFLIFAKPFEGLMLQLTSQPTHQVANSHTLFNIFSAIVFYPFINLGSTIIEKIFPKPTSEKEFGAKYLDVKAFSEPHLAYANAVRELLRMVDYTYEMVKLSITSFERDSLDLIDEIKNIDKKVDTLNREIKLYLIRLADESLSKAQKTRVVSMIALVSDIENIGDVIDKNVLVLARKKYNLKLTFSDQGWSDVKLFHEKVIKNFEMAVSAFSLASRELAEKVIQNKHEIRVLEQKMREAHIQRLHLKFQESFNTSNIHLDLLSAYRRVNSYVCNLAYPVLFSDPKSFESDMVKTKFES